MLNIFLIGICLLIFVALHVWRRNRRIARENEARIVQLVRRA